MANTNLSVSENNSLLSQVKELKTRKTDARNLATLEQKISEMPRADAVLANNLHQLVTNIAPNLKGKTWYGMPAYINEDKQIIFFFQPAAKFSARYAVLVFNDSAHLDADDFWPTSFAIKKWTPAVAKKIETLIKLSIK